MSKTHGIPIESLGRPALLQLQKQGVNVDRYLNKSAKNVLGKLSPVTKFGVVSAKESRTEDGIVFDSKLELAAYKFLRDHHILFERQVEFILEEGFERNGKKYRPFKYVTDFVIPTKGERLTVDMKGMKTRMFMLQQKLMVLKHGIEIQCIKSVSELAILMDKHGLLIR